MKAKLRLTYGILNYTLATLLLIMPFLNTIEHSVVAHIIPSSAGAFLLIASLLTNYELGFFRFITFRENLVIGIIIGIFLFLSPFIFNFYVHGYLFHLFTGSVIFTMSVYVHKSIFVNRHKRIINA
jgi:hypothetical protein